MVDTCTRTSGRYLNRPDPPRMKRGNCGFGMRPDDCSACLEKDDSTAIEKSKWSMDDG